MPFTQIIIFLPIVVFSVVIHEYAHGWVALKCGDPTARDAGRLTLNPLPHLDLFGSLILPGFLIMIGSVPFAMAKPVPVNPYLFRRGEKDNVLVSVSGVAANILLALCAFILSLVVVIIFKSTNASFILAIFRVLNLIVMLNLVLANFNLLPIPPLDGSHVLSYFLKGEAKIAYLRLGRYGLMILFGLILLGNRLPIRGGLFSLLLAPSFSLMDLARRIQASLLV